MTEHVTKTEIARVAGVARSAVSMVLNNRPHTLAQTTVRRILSAARELKYVNRARADIHCIAFIAQGEDFFEATDDLFQRVAKAILSELNAQEYNVIPGFLQGKEGSGWQLPRVLREGGVDGFVALVADQEGYQKIRAQTDRLALRTVFCAWKAEDGAECGWVINDDLGGARDVATQVARLGHRRVAIVSASGTKNPAARERLEGYLGGLAAQGIEAPTRWIVDGHWTREEGRRCMQAILERGRPFPTAVLCSNDWQALGAMEVARERGIAIPREMSFIGFDGCKPAIAMSTPELTTVAHDLETLGRTAAQELVNWIETRHTTPPVRRIPTELRVGRSLCAPLASERP